MSSARTVLPSVLSSEPLLSSIFPFLSFHELISCINITSKHWNRILQDENIWKMMKIKHIIITKLPPKAFWTSSLLSTLSVSLISLHVNIPPDPTAVNIVNSIDFFDESASASQLAIFDSITRVFLLPHYISHSPLASTLQSLSFAGTFTPSLCRSVIVMRMYIRVPVTNTDYENTYRQDICAGSERNVFMLFEPILRHCRSLTSLDAHHLVFSLASLNVEDMTDYHAYPAFATLTHLKASNIYASQLYHTKLHHIDVSQHHSSNQRDANGNIVYDSFLRLECMFPSEEYPAISEPAASMLTQLLSSSSSSSSAPWRSPRSSPLSSSLLTINLSGVFFSLYQLACVLSHIPSLHTIILSSESAATVYEISDINEQAQRYGLKEITQVVQNIRSDITIIVNKP